MRKTRFLAFAGATAATLAALVATQVATAHTGAKATAAASPGCQLNSAKGTIKHVIYVQFDNTHLSRDISNVPSDLELMPHLLNFLRGNGTVLGNHHTILISHTAGGILSSLTGLYPDRNGITVSNSYDYYRTNPVNGIYSGTFTSAFKYWTAPVDPMLDPRANLVNGDSGTAKNTPAPWVTYTRAGCDFGAVSTANVVLENAYDRNNPTNSDTYKVFGPTSAEYAEAANPATRAKAQTDFVGIAVHCSTVGGGICAGNTNAKADVLPDEPGGYAGQGLFGAKYVDPAITGGAAAVNDLNGNPIKDPAGNPGFPGFDAMTAAVSLGYVAQMQEAGIPVTYAYISDAHDNHAGQGAYGPGEAGYVAALKNYDDAFAKFFTRLANDGIDQSNTLFVFTADENDHYAGQPGQNCDGVTTPCVYQHGVTDLTNGASASSSTWTPPAWPPASQTAPLVGEIGMDLKWLFGPMPSGYDISFDSAPSFYIDGQPQAVDSSGSIVLNPTLRAFEQRAANVKAFDPYIDTTQFTPVANFLADAPTLKALHMINADPQRTMSFTMFSKPDLYFQTFSPCPSPQKACLNSAFAYIHGDYAPDIGRTWLGIVGPGVKNSGVTNRVWSDHTDIQPTIMSLLGLKDDYTPDGRVLADSLQSWALPRTLRAHRETLLELGSVYKQLNAPYGDFANSALVASTAGIKSDDAAYLRMEGRIQSLTTRRDALASEIRAGLNAAAFDSRALDERQAETWIDRADNLLESARTLAGLEEGDNGQRG